MFPFGGGIGGPELLIVGIVALLLFGKRLPEVAKNLGKGFVEFKKGISGIEEEVRSASTTAASRPSRPAPDESLEEVTAPKFEPPVEEEEPVETQNN